MESKEVVMETLRKPLSVILGLIAFAVLFHFVLNPFYEDAVDAISVWHVLNWFMAFGVIVTLALTYVGKRNVSTGDADTNRYICINLAFYVAAILAILFFWNWFDDLTAGEDGQSSNRGIFWAVINTLLVVLVGTVSARLWNGDSSD